MTDENIGKGLTRAELEDNEDLALGNALLRALAEVTDNATEIAPGVWYVEKRDDARGYWI